MSPRRTDLSIRSVIVCAASLLLQSYVSAIFFRLLLLNAKDFNNPMVVDVRGLPRSTHMSVMSLRSAGAGANAASAKLSLVFNPIFKILPVDARLPLTMSSLRFWSSFHLLTVGVQLRIDSITVSSFSSTSLSTSLMTSSVTLSSQLSTSTAKFFGSFAMSLITFSSSSSPPLSSLLESVSTPWSTVAMPALASSFSSWASCASFTAWTFFLASVSRGSIVRLSAMRSKDSSNSS
mmetsp:Transcript_33184/g.53178  ORF Transcript_33184/g.53178 Transcript_33184/m.53178 type:complete len:235 (-) Transcript_33184:467-1171(-)